MAVFEEYDDVLSPLEILTILAVANLPDRSVVNPDDHFGIAEEIRACIEDKDKAVADMLKKVTGLDWNPSLNYRQFIIDAHAERSAIDKAISLWGCDNRRRSDAVKIVEHERAVPGSVKPGPLQRARDLLLLPPVDQPEGFVPIPEENL